MLSEKLWVHDPKVVEAQVTNGRGFQEGAPKSYHITISAIPVLEHLRRMDVEVNAQEPDQDQILKSIRFGREFWGLGVFSYLSPTSFRNARDLIQHFTEKTRELDEYFAQAIQRAYNRGLNQGKTIGWYGDYDLSGKIAPKPILDLLFKKDLLKIS